MKVTVTVEVVNDNGSLFSKSSHENGDLSKVAAVALRDRLSDGIAGVYKAISAEVGK